MMRSVSILAAATCLITSFGVAQTQQASQLLAEDQSLAPYIGFRVTRSRIEGFNVNSYSPAVGVKYGNFRAEFEFSLFDDCKLSDSWAEDDDKGDFVDGGDFVLTVKHRLYALQLYYDVPVYTRINAFINAGVGFATFDITDDWSSDFYDDGVDKFSENGWAWNVGCGLTYELTRNLSFDASIRYTKLYTDILDPSAIGVSLGTRFTF